MLVAELSRIAHEGVFLSVTNVSTIDVESAQHQHVSKVLGSIVAGLIEKGCIHRSFPSQQWAGVKHLSKAAEAAEA